jgi:hypothetical protein
LVFLAGNGTRGKLGNPAHLEEMVVTMKSTAAGESVFKVTFDWDASHGIPGAVVVKNTYRAEFLLKTLTLEGVPGKQDGTVVFVANSWIYPGADRVFFANDVSIHSVLVSHAIQTNRLYSLCMVHPIVLNYSPCNMDQINWIFLVGNSFPASSKIMLDGLGTVLVVPSRGRC